LSDRSFLRLGGGTAVVGGLLALVGNVLHPRYSNLDDVDRFRLMAGSSALIASDLVLLAAFACVIAGFVAIAASLDEGRVSGLARFGRVSAIVGGAIALAETGIETFALVQSAKIFASASDANRVGAFWATSAVDHLNTGLFATWTVVLLGLVPLLLGLAIVLNRRYPVWLGVAGVLGGVLCLAVGVFELLRTDQNPTVIPFFIGSLLDTGWLLWAGVLLWRRSAPAGAAAPSAAEAGLTPGAAAV
jgi:hypothetical protein